MSYNKKISNNIVTNSNNLVTNNNYIVRNKYPNYIPVKNRYDFEYDVYAYYNQYCATSYETQQRRIMRNYFSNQQTIKQFNKNVFINNKTKIFNFLYTNGLTYMIVEDKMQNNIVIYILINNSWCTFKKFSNKLECQQFINLIKSNALKNYP
jgi:hypothetical protein